MATVSTAQIPKLPQIFKRIAVAPNHCSILLLAGTVAGIHWEQKSQDTEAMCLALSRATFWVHAFHVQQRCGGTRHVMLRENLLILPDRARLVSFILLLVRLLTYAHVQVSIVSW